ncbi:hypothetical protein A3K89_13045 [Rhodococcoides kyotonense]|uniref:Uncharacterized protein n=1 Tax=Rhodococcoides kyotonense TaxID=398843 RepID=A0A177Y7G3_9NOCA|nr:hypothetical protein A3K89_13045 [Rhodococcus kyotonensis]
MARTEPTAAPSVDVVTAADGTAAAVTAISIDVTTRDGRSHTVITRTSRSPAAPARARRVSWIMVKAIITATSGHGAPANPTIARINRSLQRSATVSTTKPHASSRREITATAPSIPSSTEATRTSAAARNSHAPPVHAAADAPAAVATPVAVTTSGGRRFRASGADRR